MADMSDNAAPSEPRENETPSRFTRKSVSDVLQALSAFRQEWEQTPRPNDLSTDYPFDRMTELIRSTSQLDVDSKDLILDSVKTIIEQIQLPEILDADVDISNLRLHWRMSKFQELLFEIIYHSTAPETIRRSEGEEKELNRNEIRSLSEKMDKISEEISEIRKGKSFGGVSVNILGVSTPLDTIWKAVQNARRAISARNVDTSIVQKNLEDAYTESKGIWERLSQSASGVTDAILETFRNLVLDVGSALQDILGISKRSKRDSLSITSFKLNGKLSIDEMIEIRNIYRSINKNKLQSREIHSVLDKHISSFMYGIDIDGDKKRIKISTVDNFNEDILYVNPVYFDDDGNKKHDPVLMRRDLYLEKISSFLDFMISTLSKREEFTLKVTALEPVLTVEDAGIVSDLSEPLGI